MSKQDLEQRHKRVAKFVGDLEEGGKPDALFSMGVVSRRLADGMNLVETTARKHLKAAVQAGVLVEVKHIGRSLQFPWPVDELTKGSPERFVQGSVNRGSFWMTEEHQLGPAMTKITFVFTPQRLQEVMEQARQADAEKAAIKQKREQEEADRRTAELTVERVAFAKHYPALAELLWRLEERVMPPEDSGLGLRVTAKEHPTAGVISRVHIEVTDERYAELEAVLRDGLGKGSKG